MSLEPSSLVKNSGIRNPPLTAAPFHGFLPSWPHLLNSPRILYGVGSTRDPKHARKRFLLTLIVSRAIPKEA